MLSTYYIFSGIYIPVDRKSEICLLLTVLFFAVGYILGKWTNKTNVVFDNESYLKRGYDKGLLRVMQFFAFIILSYAAIIDILSMLQGKTMGYFRYNILPGIRTPIYLSLMMYIANPIVWITIPISIIQIYYRQADRKDVFWLILLFITCLLSSGGGRAPLLYFAVCTAVIISIKPLNINLSSGMKRRLVFVAIILVIFIAIISWKRGSIWYQELASYISIPVAALERHRNIADSNSIRCYGFLTFQGFLRPIELLMRALGSEIINDVDKAYWYIDQRMVLTRLGETSNSTVTCSTYFYYDGGVVGVILLSFLFGLSAVKLYYRMINIFNVKNISLYMIMSFFIVFSFVNISSAHIEWGFAIIWLLIIGGKFRVTIGSNRFE
jgi:oligosaccharide repeat unit polymerase